MLDGIRATRSFSGSPGPIGLWGYSGGALASGWTAELAPGYAPELTIAGVAEGGLPVNPGNILNKINGGPFAGLAMSGIAGLSQAYPPLADFLATHLTPVGRAAFATAATQCNDPMQSWRGGQVVAETIPGARFLLLPGVGHDLPREVWPAVLDEIMAMTQSEQD